MTDSADCPTCGRWLVRVYDDGTFDLNAKATADVRLLIQRPVPDVNERAAMLVADVAEMKILSAVCNLWRCKTRRFFGGGRTDDSATHTSTFQPGMREA